MAKVRRLYYYVGNDSRDGRTHICAKNPLIVGAVVCKLRGFEAKRQQIKNILHRQRSSLFIFIFITFSILPFRQNPHVVY